jgi:hypothetical protein
MHLGVTRSRRAKRLVIASAVAAVGLLFAAACPAEEILIVGDTRLKPVVDLISGIRQTLKKQAKVYAFPDVKGELEGVVAREGARAVIALGKEAIADALKLPPSVAVIYDLTILPPQSDRPNTTGSSMATPVAEYVNLFRKYLPSLKRISAVGNRDLLNAVGAAGFPQVSTYLAGNSFDLVKKVNEIEGTDALLLLPDAASLTPTAMEEIYLYSFRNKVPLLGISEKHVKEGALLALVFDPVAVGRQIGEVATEALNGADLGRIPPSPARKFDLFLNTAVARTMGIAIPAEMLRRAKRVYP